MKRLQRAAVLLTVLEALKDNGSWCGETNIQKSCYLLEELVGVPLELRFQLYKHGPYSFDLTDELTGLQADSIVELISVDERYGPKYIPGKLAEVVKERFPKTIATYQPKIRFLAERIGGKRVPELERLATAFYVRQTSSPGASVSDRASALVELKPHIDRDDARRATEEIDRLCAEVAAL